MVGKQKSPLPTRRTSARSDKPVFSYYGNRAPAQAPRPRSSKNRNVPWRLIPSFIALAVILGSLAYASTLDLYPRISTDRSGAQVLLQDESVYTAAAQKYLKGSIFNRSKLLINTKPIEEQLQAEFPELKTVGITIPLTSRRPIVTLKAAEPRLQLQTDAGQYIIDSQGRAVRQVSDTALAGELGLALVKDESSLQLTLGKVALSAREAAFLSEVHHQLTAQKLTIESMTLPPLANELHVRLKDRPYYIKFNMLGDARQQVGTFIATQDHLRKNNLSVRQYIDVRVDEKAFYQ